MAAWQGAQAWFAHEIGAEGDGGGQQDKEESPRHYRYDIVAVWCL